MADNFNMTKFLKENNLGSYGVLGKYVDLHKLNEASEYADGEDNQYDGQYDHEFGPAIANEADSFIQAQGDASSDFDSEDFDRMWDLGGREIESSIINLLDDGFSGEDVLDFCKMTIDAHAGNRSQGNQISEALDVRSIAKNLIDAVRSGKDVSIQGLDITNVIPPMGILIASDGTKFKIADLVANDELDTVTIDGESMATPQMAPKSPMSRPSGNAQDFQDRFGPGGGYETGMGRYTGD